MIESKNASTTYTVNKLIKERWSPRSFSNEALGTEDLKSLFEAMSWAASARNEQPWKMIVGIKNKGGAYDKIFSCLDTWNQKWASSPVLAIAIAKKNIDGKANHSYAYDCGAAMATLSLQAISKEIYVHQMGGIDAKKVIQLFNIPSEEYEVMAGIAIGKLGKIEDLDVYYQEMEKASRSRKNIEEFVFGEIWGKASEDLF